VLRHGAYARGIFEDTSNPSRFLGTSLIESQVEYLRRHNQRTNANRTLQDDIRRLSEGTPKITHLVAADLGLALACVWRDFEMHTRQHLDAPW
jgi:Transmembrane secretion effector